MYKYKQTTDVEIGDLVLWTNQSSANRIANKPYRVISTDNTLVGIKDENNNTNYYGSVSRKTLQTKPADQAVVGDYMYRVSSGGTRFPQYTVMRITKINAKSNISNLYYASTSSVSFNEVIVIAQAEPEVKYPYFRHGTHRHKPLIIKQNRDSYTYIHIEGELLGKTFSGISGQVINCDFTIEPEIDDIDWWQSRFEAGLPVYAVESDGTAVLCTSSSPKQWEHTRKFSMTDPSLTLKQDYLWKDIPLSVLHLGLCQEIPLGATAECSLQPTIKEQPMNKTTLKLLLELLGASEEVKDATNSKFVGIITNEDEYVGYMYFDSKEDATECMAQPKMELHKLHLFEKSCVLAQKPRKVIEV